MDRELLRGSVPLLILSLLSEGSMYGYQIIETVKDRTNGVLVLAEGTLYPALQKLEIAGFISSYWETQPNGRERHYYQLLPAGKALLDSKRSEWNEFVGMVAGIVSPR